MQDFISYNKAVEANNLAIVANKNCRPYKSNTDFEMGDLTIYDDKIYQALSSFKSAISFDDTKWKLLANTSSDIIVVDTLPISEIQANKIYILADYSLNYYDGSWHKLGSNQIIPSTTAPTDTTRFWLDTTLTTAPILKWHNGTTWVNISGSSNSINDNTKSTTSTYSSEKIVSLIDNQGDYNTSYSYNGDGKISGYIITGDKVENTSYTYFTSGDNIGKIETETIIKDGKTLVNTFSYTNGKISGITTATN